MSENLLLIRDDLIGLCPHMACGDVVLPTYYPVSDNHLDILLSNGGPGFTNDYDGSYQLVDPKDVTVIDEINGDKVYMLQWRPNYVIEMAYWVPLQDILDGKLVNYVRRNEADGRDPIIQWRIGDGRCKEFKLESYIKQND